MRGLVYKSTGTWYIVKDDSGRIWSARIKGKMKMDTEISSTNPIAVGDNVIFEIEDENANTAIISLVSDRNNYIIRVSPHNPNQKHIIASNIDLAVLITSIAEPRTSTGFIDRFLITTEAYHIPVIVVINKKDIIKKNAMETAQKWMEIYSNAGYEVLCLSAKEADSLLELKARLKNRCALFSGHSGVGKSTLINQLIPNLAIKTKSVSEWSGKGQHTTTFAEMFDNPDGGVIIDTPGVKEFGLIDIERQELSHCFPEIRREMNNCKFNNCLHVDEPNCVVKKAVTENRISVDRYANYIAILDSIEKKW